MTEGISPLHKALLAEATRPLPPAVTAIAEVAARRHGEAVRAVLFYGSCLWDGYGADKLVDLFVLVDSYAAAYREWPPRVFNALLPPNVYFVDTEHEGQTVRAKYAVISIADFRAGAGGDWLHSYIWARFAQPSAIAMCRLEQDKTRVVGACADAVTTLLRESLPLLPARFTTRELWVRAFVETYRAELRSEGPDRAERLFDAAAEYYSRITEAAMHPRGPFEKLDLAADSIFQEAPSPRHRRRAARRWWRRRATGKFLSVLRLVKAAFTVENGGSYLLWKIQRHSGVRMAITPWQARHPLLASTVMFWRLYRKGGFR